MKLRKIHSDSRRDIFLVDGHVKGDEEFTIINLKCGKAIGGCIHKKNEGFFVLSGKVTVGIGKSKMICEAGEGGVIPGEMPHMFYAHKSSIICEWGVEASDKFRKDKKMREKVDKINEN